mmetsp:Transcript_91822/g.264835  ORF Transcript_91822/g.264835 Transcript_91822/m.264835 type:complete len:429 (+) Transcript_91822:78-1364(+)
MDRVARISQHIISAASQDAAFCPSPTSAAMCAAEKSDDDVVICSALRTPIGKASRGSFKDTPPEELLVPLFKATLERTKIDPKLIEDIQIGNASQPGAGAISSRMSQFLAGVPYDAALTTVNRQCSSGLQAIANIAGAIRTGMIDVGIAGGVETMSMFGMMDGVDFNKLSGNILENELARSCLLPMGMTSENVAAKYGLSREVQDAMAADSHRKAIAAQKAGLFKDEIVPVTARVKDKKTGAVKEVTVSEDEGPREGTTPESLSKLKPVFKAHGSTTAGNASQVSDGAAMCLLARRSKAKELGLPILARIRSFAVVGVDPALMGVGPAFAIPEALKRANLTVDDIDIFEVNEAFASQAKMSIDHCKIPMEKVNPKGGAIALGHPLGCTGSRQVATLLPELKRQGKKLGLTSMCIGTGMGAAAVFESEQ